MIESRASQYFKMNQRGWAASRSLHISVANRYDPVMEKALDSASSG